MATLNLYLKALNYARENQQQFQLDINSTVNRTAIDKRNIVSLALFFISFGGVSKIGYTAFITLLPVYCAIYLPLLVSIKTARLEDFCRRHACYYWDFLCFLSITSLTWTYIWAHSVGRPNQNGAIQACLIGFGIFALNRSFKYLLIRNVLFSLAAGLLILIYDQQYFMTVGSQFIGGCVGSNLICYIAFRQNILKFYLLSSYRRSNLHLQDQLSTMVYPHQLELLKNYASLESTMPLESREGIACELDIIDSTNFMLHPEYNRAKILAFKKCYDILQASYKYDGESCNCDAHVVKETGDGFIFTVGYPIHCSRQNMDLVAFELACSFIDVCEEVFRETIREKVNISVTLTRSNLQGFWTKNQVKAFDLIQSSLVQLARISATRRVIIEKYSQDLTNRSVIIIDSIIQKNISNYPRDIKVTKIDLRSLGIKVRNFSEIDTLFFCETVKEVQERTVVNI